MFDLINLLGGLGLFLFGMRIMSDGIQRSAGKTLKALLNFMTKNRLIGVATGILITSLIQSSSATTVMLVSLVNAKLITLVQSVGVIMGANIGTTFTGWIVSLLGFKIKIVQLALPMIALSIPLYFSRIRKRRNIGEFLFGFGILFIGLDFMKAFVPDIRNNPEILGFLKHFSQMGYLSILLFILVGTIITIVMQSSSAAMAVTITMAYKGWITFPCAAAIVLGENIGTTITAYIASIGMSSSAKKCARAHLLFNLIGVGWILLVFFPFIGLVDIIVPHSFREAKNIPTHLAAFHSLFNVINTTLLICFVPQLSALAEKLVKQKHKKGRAFIDDVIITSRNIPDSADINIININNAISNTGKNLHNMLLFFLNSVGAEKKKAKQLESDILGYSDQISENMEKIRHSMIETATEPLAEKQSAVLYSNQMVLYEFERIRYSILDMTAILKKQAKGKHAFNEALLNEVKQLTMNVLDFTNFNIDYLNRRKKNPDLKIADKMEENIDQKEQALKKATRKYIKKGSDLKTELLFLDIIKHLEHIGDYNIKISRILSEE